VAVRNEKAPAAGVVGMGNGTESGNGEKGEWEFHNGSMEDGRGSMKDENSG